MSTAMDMADDPWMANGPWTVEDLARLPDDGQRYEIIDGGLLVSPPPAVGHQGITHRLTALLNRDIGAGWEALEAVGIVLRRLSGATRMLVPDVVVASETAVWSGEATLGPDNVLIAAEVVSPSSVAKDRILKPALLAEAGIPAYWRVEQDTSGPTIVMHRLVRGAYTEEDVVRPGESRRIEWPVACHLVPAELAGRRA